MNISYAYTGIVDTPEALLETGGIGSIENQANETKGNSKHASSKKRSNLISSISNEQ